MKEGFGPYAIKAENHLKRINELMDFLGEKRFLTPDEKAKARELMRQIKEGLKQDANLVHTGSRTSRPSQEAEDFASAMLEAKTRLRAKSNSDPIRSYWHSELYACSDDISFFLANK